MKIERSQSFGITSILDRNGKKVGNYLVDRSKDSLNREKKEQPNRADEEAVVIHNNEGDVPVASGLEIELKVTAAIGSLDITA
jgi:hypothetical protein